MSAGQNLLAFDVTRPKRALHDVGLRIFTIRYDIRVCLTKVHVYRVDACLDRSAIAGPILPNWYALEQVCKEESKGPAYHETNHSIQQDAEFSTAKNPEAIYQPRVFDIKAEGSTVCKKVTQLF